jgi:hypothetical protein
MLRAPDHTLFDSTLALHAPVTSVRTGDALEAHTRDGVAEIVMAGGPCSVGAIAGSSLVPQCANRRRLPRRRPTLN